MAKQPMNRHDARREVPADATIRLAGRRVRLVPLVAVLGLGLALAGCDKCTDFFWQKPGACKAGPAPN
ncbi:MAG: hypothetical protein QOG74_3614 [Alphaproteobacteria bacterium]|nr:hypothetical protein [Alphaproteobacteria bacterium]